MLAHRGVQRAARQRDLGARAGDGEAATRRERSPGQVPGGAVLEPDLRAMWQSENQRQGRRRARTRRTGRSGKQEDKSLTVASTVHPDPSNSVPAPETARLSLTSTLAIDVPTAGSASTPPPLIAIPATKVSVASGAVDKTRASCCGPIESAPTCRPAAGRQAELTVSARLF